MFKAAAYTRKYDIEHSKSFDPRRDKVVIIPVTDLYLLKDQVENAVTNNSKDYGETVEFGIWSHAAVDSPIGSKPTSQHAVDGYQLGFDGWAAIKFNWSDENSRAGFYGCNTGNDTYFDAFSTVISGLDNFANVTTLGQTTSSFPSVYANFRSIATYQLMGN